MCKLSTCMYILTVANNRMYIKTLLKAAPQ